jgi:hypothetical protein
MGNLDSMLGFVVAVLVDAAEMEDRAELTDKVDPVDSLLSSMGANGRLGGSAGG